MKALVTGASSGIGRDMAKYLAKKGYDLILVARRQNLLEEIQSEINNVNVEIEVMDVSKEENIYQLFQKHQDIDILINNAGFGKFGEFIDIDIETEINMINTNIIAVQMLTKLYLQDMVKKNRGYILNVASVVGLLPRRTFNGNLLCK